MMEFKVTESSLNKKPEALKPSLSGDPVESRRKFVIAGTGLAWIAFAGAATAGLSGVLRFFFPEPDMSFNAGKPEDYKPGAVDARWLARHEVWVVRTLDGIYALIAKAPGLGCSPSWIETEQQFKCSCHGSGFYKSGIAFEGPSKKPLERAAVRLSKDGDLIIDKAKRFKFEKGGWNHPESFLRF